MGGGNKFWGGGRPTLGGNLTVRGGGLGQNPKGSLKKAAPYRFWLRFLQATKVYLFGGGADPPPRGRTPDPPGGKIRVKS